MSLDDFSLDEIGADQIDSAKKWLLAALAESFPDTDFSRGAVYGTVILPTATILAAISRTVEKLANSHNLETLSEVDVDDDEITSFLRNYGITRRPASKAAGQIRLILSSDNQITIYEGTKFTTENGIAFLTTDTVIGVPGVPGSGEQQLKSFGSYWYLLLPAKAEKEGVSGNISAGTELTPDVEIGSFIAAAAEDTFAGGADVEDVASLTSRLLSGIAAGTFSSPVQLLALIHSAARNGKIGAHLEGVRATSVVGAGDAEMLRDKRGLFPVGVGGRCDVYVKSSDQPTIVVKKYTALLIGRTAVEGDGIWKVEIGADDAPGFLKVIRVTRHGDINHSGYEVVGDIRSYDLPDDGRYLPDITNAAEAAYSPFQTGTITFVDTDTIVIDSDVGVKTGEYDLYMLAMPYLSELQQFLSNDFIKPPALDVLVKSPVPMYVSITVDLAVDVDDDTKSGIISAVYSFVATRLIGHTLTKAEIAGVVAPLLPSTNRVLSVALSGEIRSIYGEDITVNPDSAGKLNIPDLPEKGITEKTVMLIADLDSISVN